MAELAADERAVRRDAVAELGQTLRELVDAASARSDRVRALQVAATAYRARLRTQAVAVLVEQDRARTLLRQAQERLDQLRLLTSVTVRYGVAYDACHDTGEALGRRTASGRPTGRASTRRSAATCAW